MNGKVVLWVPGADHAGEGEFFELTVDLFVSSWDSVHSVSRYAPIQVHAVRGYVERVLFSAHVSV